LLSNAVKYTPEGGTITAGVQVDEAKKKVIARISDTGVGIPPRDLPFVFDKFYRCEANSRMAKGTGLGLSLVKHIIETVHHGRIFVESVAGKGSTFGFELDLTEGTNCGFGIWDCGFESIRNPQSAIRNWRANE